MAMNIRMSYLNEISIFLAVVICFAGSMLGAEIEKKTLQNGIYDDFFRECSLGSPDIMAECLSTKLEKSTSTRPFSVEQSKENTERPKTTDKGGVTMKLITQEDCQNGEFIQQFDVPSVDVKGSSESTKYLQNIMRRRACMEKLKQQIEQEKGLDRITSQRATTEVSITTSSPSIMTTQKPLVMPKSMSQCLNEDFIQQFSVEEKYLNYPFANKEYMLNLHRQQVCLEMYQETLDKRYKESLKRLNSLKTTTERTTSNYYEDNYGGIENEEAYLSLGFLATLFFICLCFCGCYGGCCTQDKANMENDLEGNLQNRPINIGSSAVHDAYILENQGWEMTHGPLRKPEQEDISAVPVNTEPSTTTIMNTGAISSPYSKPTLNIPESGAAAESFTLNQNQSNSANLVLSETPSLQPPSYEEAVNSPR